MSFLSCIFTILVSLVLPILAALAISSRIKHSLRPVILGALTFTFFQLLTRMPLIQVVLPSIPYYNEFAASNHLIIVIFMGVTAGLFEEFGRFIVMKKFLKNQNDTMSAVAFGIGHGGIEAILIVGINSIFILLYQLPFIVPAQMFTAGIERLLTLMLHIGLSIMVMKSVREHNFKWVFLAFVVHSLVDIVVPTLYSITDSFLITEGALALFTIPIIVFSILNIRKECR